MPVLIALGTVNVLYGAISAMSQRDLKYVVGYSSVSHMGLVLMGIATLGATFAPSIELLIAARILQALGACATLVVVGARRPDDGLYRNLLARAGDWEAAGVKSVDRIGDCQVPSSLTRIHARPFAPSSFLTNVSRRSTAPRPSCCASWTGRHFTIPP